MAIVGPNGSGKSTLLRALLGELPLAVGPALARPGRAWSGELDQARGRLRRRRGAARRVPGADRDGHAARPARCWPSSASAPTTSGGPAATLSPGERTRAVLAMLMAEGVNCLVLDEPTNHLDLEAIEQLEQALDAFEGTLLLVTHDRRFLEAVHVTRTIELA